MSVKGSGSTDWTDIEVFGSVVAWLDEQMQTWLPLCESSLLTTVTKNQSEMFLPVYILYKVACWQQELGFGPAIQQQFVLLDIFLLFYFGYMPFLSIIWQKKKREKKIHSFVCLVVNDKLNQCRPIVRQLSWNHLAAEFYFANEWNDHVWWCSVCTYIFLTVINW